MKAIIITADGKISQCDVEKNGKGFTNGLRKSCISALKIVILVTLIWIC